MWHIPPLGSLSECLAQCCLTQAPQPLQAHILHPAHMPEYPSSVSDGNCRCGLFVGVLFAAKLKHTHPLQSISIVQSQESPARHLAQVLTCQSCRHPMISPFAHTGKRTFEGQSAVSCHLETCGKTAARDLSRRYCDWSHSGAYLRSRVEHILYRQSGARGREQDRIKWLFFSILYMSTTIVWVHTYETHTGILCVGGGCSRLWLCDV